MSLTPWKRAESGTEHGEQSALFMWANMAVNFGLTAANDPKSYTVAGHAAELLRLNADPVEKLKWLHAIHNQGHGDAIRGGRAKAEGVKAGVFDVFLPVRVRDFNVPLGTVIPVLYCGLYIEMKRADGGKPSPEQLAFQKDIRAAGYAAEICHGWLEAAAVLLKYIRG